MTHSPEFERQEAARDSVDRGVASSTVAALQERYEEYCRGQVSLLLEIVPREAVRHLYRSARSWATQQGLHESKDPMSTLRSFCRELLPMPPFEAWVLDYEDHRLAYLSAGVGLSPLNQSTEPVAIELRRIRYEAEPWQGTLEVYRGGEAWRGLIRFQREGGGDYFRTGEIFCEDDLQELRDRFVSFTASTLSAFLRSTLP